MFPFICVLTDSDNEEPEPMPEGNTTDENIDPSYVIQTQSEQHAAGNLLTNEWDIAHHIGQ